MIGAIKTKGTETILEILPNFDPVFWTSDVLPEGLGLSAKVTSLCRVGHWSSSQNLQELGITSPKTRSHSDGNSWRRDRFRRTL